jgi:phosphatidylserine decarboxylase
MLANSKNTKLKNYLIRYFLGKYTIDMREAQIEDPYAYASFNDFFTRALKDGARPINAEQNIIASPADGTIAQLGRIDQQQMLQAKGMYFNLSSLLGNDAELTQRFTDGHFATVYLAPHNYHRVHMPLAGKLIQSIYIPGRLFSVNRMTSQLIPNLYARNERLVLVFETQHGPMAVILVGALIVGSIQTVWMNSPIRSHQIENSAPSRDIVLEKGAELGHFQLGSTVIVLLSAPNLSWMGKADASILTGQSLGSL